jgi:topoisomerase-4 subunit A
MSEFVSPEENQDNEGIGKIKHISGLYRDWFLDYASYVILERAVPAMEDGLKPVQRRILHAMKELDDGRYHKVANIIGHTMKYHPHGDASIGDALVNLGQKNLLIDQQGNWGNIYTGDRAAAPRYIEARLTKFALDVLYNAKITTWLSSYDGRGKEPETLPAKFPLLLYHGVEGIAVGLSTKILPHNFNELIDASIAILRKRSFKLVPDFPTGGMMDASNYDDGRKGGKVRVRAKIQQEDKKRLKITELPYGCTTNSLIESVLKANEKGKIKIKRIEDNTAEHVEIMIYLQPNISPDQTIDALYAFTDCEVSISPLCCVIIGDKPAFLGVSDILKSSTAHTVELLKSELEIRLKEAEDNWHMSSLEKIFIENRIYLRIEECETWEEVISEIRIGLEPFKDKLIREITDEDIARLTEIKIKRISKYDSLKAEESILKIEALIDELKHHLANLIDYAVDFFKEIKKKYGKGKERKTEIGAFGNINAARVAISNQKLYVNREEGFVGTSLKKDEFVQDCSDIDNIIVFLENGKMIVSKVDEKKFFGKNIIHVAVFRKNDVRTIYNLMYTDGMSRNTYMKRFYVKSITRDKEYTVTSDSKGTKLLYFTANPNGEAEVVSVELKTQTKVRKLKFDIDFSELAVKGRSSKGNLVSKYPVKKVVLKSEGISTLTAQKIWFDDTISRINDAQRGTLLGEFAGDDRILEISQNGSYRLLSFDLSTHFDSQMIHLEKFDPEKPMTAIYYHGEKKKYYIKRFLPEMSNNKVAFVPEIEGSRLETVSMDHLPVLELIFKTKRGKDPRANEEIEVSEFIGVKGLKAIGNQLSSYDIKDVSWKEPIPYIVEAEEDSTEDTSEDSDAKDQITLDL